MRTFNKNVENGKNFVKDALQKIAGDDFCKNWLTTDNNDLENLSDYIVNLPGLDNDLRNSLSHRITSFNSALKNGRKLINPSTPEAEQKKALENFELHFNSAMEVDNREGVNFDFVKDIAVLMNIVGHGKIEDPQFQSLIKMATFGAQIEGIADSKHKEITFNDIKSQVTEFEQSKSDFTKKFNSVVKSMHTIDPELTQTGLQAKLNSAESDFRKAENELNAFNSPLAVKSREDKRRLTEDIIAQRFKDIETNKIVLDEKKAKANFIMNESEYSLKDLQENGIRDFAKFDEDINADKKALAELAVELDDAQKRDKKLAEAQKAVSDRKKELNALLKTEEDARENFELFYSINKMVNASQEGKNLLEELSDPALKNDIFPALFDNGIIAVGGVRKKQDEAKENSSAFFVHKRNIAQKYANMRQAIIDACPDHEKAKKKFDEIEKKNLANIMEAVKDSFAEELEGVFSDGISTLSKMSSDKNDSAFMSIDGINDKMKQLSDAEANLTNLQNRLSATRDKKTIQKDIQFFNEHIAEVEQERLDTVNGFLEHFEQEPVKEPIPVEALIQIGTKKYAEVESDVRQAEDVGQKLNDIREINKLKGELKSVSKETELQQIKILGDKFNEKKKQFNALDKLMSDFKSLRNDYITLAEEQESIKEQSGAALKNAEFSHVTKGLESVNQHILDATRSGHTNSKQFDAMTKSLRDTLGDLKNGDLTREEKIEKLRDLKRSADEYLAAKKDQKFVLGTAMRKARMSNAEMISKFANDEITRQEALLASSGYKDVKKISNEKTMNKNVTEAQFSEKFRQAQVSYNQKQKSNVLVEAPDALKAPEALF